MTLTELKLEQPKIIRICAALSQLDRQLQHVMLSLILLHD